MPNFLPKMKWWPKKRSSRSLMPSSGTWKYCGGMLSDYWEGCIPPWICTHGYEEVRNYRKTLFIQNIIENGWWGGCIPHIPPLDPPLVISLHNCFVSRGQQFFSKKSYPLFADSNVSIENKINVNSNSHEQTRTLNCHLPARVPDYSWGYPSRKCLMSLKNLALKIIAPSHNGRLATTSRLHSFTL